MNCVWEVALDGKEVSYEQADWFSPYYEIAEIERSNEDKIKVSYNSFFRYEQVFSAVLSLEDENKEWKNILVDLGTHILVEQELTNGWTKKEILLRNIMYQLKSGVYGTEIKRQYQLLNSMQKYRIACYMVEQIKCGASVAMYAKALIDLLGTGVVYKNKDMSKELLIYVGEKKTQEKEELLKLINDIFLPLEYAVRIFWDTHFGVIGESRTLRYGQIELL